MPEILVHPFFTSRSPRPSAGLTVLPPTLEEAARPIADDIDIDILGNLRTLWHGATEEIILAGLTSPEYVKHPKAVLRFSDISTGKLGKRPCITFYSSIARGGWKISTKMRQRCQRGGRDPPSGIVVPLPTKNDPQLSVKVVVPTLLTSQPRSVLPAHLLQLQQRRPDELSIHRPQYGIHPTNRRLPRFGH